VEELMLVEKGALKVLIKGQPDLINDLLNTLRADPSADYLSLAHALGVSEATVKRHIQKLKQQDRLRRVGSRKTGHWKVLE
jgi:ATP-dependent DNA helicase RecG